MLSETLIINSITFCTDSILVFIFCHCPCSPMSCTICVFLNYCNLSHLFFDTNCASCVVCPVSAEGEEQEQPAQAGSKTKRLPREVKTRLAKVARLAVCAIETFHSLALALWLALHVVMYYGQ